MLVYFDIVFSALNAAMFFLNENGNPLIRALNLAVAIICGLDAIVLAIKQNN